MTYDAEIGQAFDFYEEDLAANNVGILSSDQQIVVANTRRAKGGERYGTELLSVSGPFTWSSNLRSDWWGEIGGVRFPLDRLQQESLEDGANYRLNYLTVGDAAWVMSIERC